MEKLFSGIISVRTSSTRLPKKCLLKFGDNTVIEHIIDRCKNYNIEPILCTSTDPEDDILIEIAKERKIKFFRGSLLNKGKRWSDCASYFSLKEFHTIDADDPFFDGTQMKESIEYLIDTNSDVITPTKTSSNGAASVGYSFKSDLIHKVSEKFNEEIDTEYIWDFINQINPIKKLTLPEKNIEKIKMRLTLDYEEDFLILNMVRLILGKEAKRDEINDLFKRNPDLHLINWFRNEDYLKNQSKKK